MKKYIYLLFALFLVQYSCVEKTFDPVLSPGAAPIISSPADGSSFVITEDVVGDNFGTFSWSAADYGFPAGIDYIVEIDVAGNEFADAVSLGLVNALTLEGVTNETVNGIMLTKGRPDGVESAMEIRVVAKVSDEVEPLVSESITLMINPFKTVINYPKLQVPGNYQGWDPANEQTVIFSVKQDNTFEGYMYFPTPSTEYKFTDGPSWAVNWGDDGADGTLESDGANILGGDAGVYKLNVDLNTFTHTGELTNWGLVGDATPGGWDSDQDMTFDQVNNLLSITLDLTAGEVKFRANDAWDLNLGDNIGNGTLAYDGANIPIAEAANYTIELILSQAEYTYTITKN